MKQVPDSLLAFQHMFPDDDASPPGWKCAGRTASSVPRAAMKRDGRCAEKHTPSSARLPPADLGDGRDDPARQQAALTGFWAAYLMATHSNGISALQLQKQLGIGSYRSAWLLAHKLRASMVDPERNPLSGLVEIGGQPSIPDDDPPTGGQGRRTARCSSSAPSNSGTETSQAACGWPKSPPTAPPTSDTSSKPPADPDGKTDGWSGYAAVPADVHVVGKTAAHLVLPWIHQVFSNLKGWARGVYHGLRAHLGLSR